MRRRYEEPVISRLIPKPSYSQNIAQPRMLLDGTWKIKHVDIPENYITEPCEEWEEMIVPSDMTAHKSRFTNYTGKYIYKRFVQLTESREDCDYILRFEGVNGFAKVYIDGQYVGEHENGFISWNLDITSHIRGKTEFELTICLDDISDQVSAYNHGGIIHSIVLYLLPSNYYTSVHTTTEFDLDYINSTLRIDYTLKDTLAEYDYRADLISPDGEKVMEIDLNSASIRKDGGRSLFIPVERPIKWDAEHPWLYTLRMRITRSSELVEEISHRFGFRQIKRVANQLFVNGCEVKLRGACRHEVSAYNGRSLTKELIDEDIALFKEANCNYIRTSHYPPSEYFLDCCDEQGIYVEDELALAFIARTLPYTQRDPKETKRYLSHFSELVARDYSHPSVIIWSLCNESFGGYNFDLLNRYAHRIDPTRPTKFSYPMTMREEHEAVDIWSIHYSNLEENLAKKCDNVSVGYTPGYDSPVLHDEYVHIPCYNRTEHRRDPNVRNFWGESIKRFWDKIWNTKGALGGAIWAGIDEINLYSGGTTCLEWGIIDIWRRRKPEFYVTRKAYSPIVVSQELVHYTKGSILVEVENRFCHTDLSEVRVEWRYGQYKGVSFGPKARPRETGLLEITLGNHEVERNTKLSLVFYDAVGNPVDEYLLEVVEAEAMVTSLKEPVTAAPEQELAVLSCEETDSHIIIRGQDFSISFHVSTGLLSEARIQQKPILVGGPYLHVPYLQLGSWQKKLVKWTCKENCVKLVIEGSYKDTMDIRFTITINPEGLIHTEYYIQELYVTMPKQVKLRVGVDCGGLDELGVYYLAHHNLDTLSWKRKGLWTIYPEDHIARNEGIAKRKSQGSAFAQQPTISWAEEMKSFILHGKYDVDYKGTNDFRSLKEHIYHASLYQEGSSGAIAAISDARHSLRLEIEEPEEFIISDRDERIRYVGQWYAMEDFTQAKNNTEMWSKEPGASAECSFTGTGIVWYGPVDMNYGIAKVYMDGVLMDDNINQKVNGVDFPGSAAGYDKKYGYPLYSITGLEEKDHTLRIEVTGRKAEDSSDAYIVIDYFRVIKQEQEEAVRFIVNNEYNYPHIAWGNYSKPPIIIEKGYCNSVTMKLIM